MNSVPELSVAEVPAAAAILDVRELDEWAAGHIPGATHIPLGDLPTRLAEIPASGSLYVICRSGKRSAQAVAWLTHQERRSVNIAGGMQAWAAAERPMESDSGAPQVI